MVKLLPWLAFGATIVVLGSGWPTDPDQGLAVGKTDAVQIEPSAAGGAVGLFAGAFPLVWAGQKIDAVIGATQKADDPLYTSSVRAAHPAEGYGVGGQDPVVDPAEDMVLKRDMLIE